VAGRRTIWRTVAAVALASAAVLGMTTPAHAIPPAGPGQSVTYTFYATAARTTEVGWWSYGSCGEPFDYGTHTAYFTIRYVSC